MSDVHTQGVGLGSSESIARVVVGVDGGAPSVRALRWAANEAALRHTDLAAVIVDPQVNLAPYAPVSTEPPARRRAALRRLLDEAVAEAVGPQSPVAVHEYVEEGSVADVLARYAKDAELLVLGNSEAERVESTLAPTIRSCIRRATCHIVVVSDGDKDDQLISG